VALSSDTQQVIEWLRASSTEEARESLARYGIPNDDALGIPMASLKKQAKAIGTSHELAIELWDSGYYEARTLAAFVDDPAKVTAEQMDRWAYDFNSWAICDTVCFRLFDKTAHAWSKVDAWEGASEEFVRRAAYALLWALALHDKRAGDERFVRALRMLENAEPDERPLVLKAMDMALRAIGKRNKALHRHAVTVAEKIAQSADKNKAWVGRHALRELTK